MNQYPLLPECMIIPNEGEVTVSFTTIISSYCSIFGKYYPMDQHTCLLNFQYKVKVLLYPLAMDTLHVVLTLIHIE